MREYVVKVSFPDLFYPPNNVQAIYILQAHNPENAAHRAKRIALPAIKSALRKCGVSQYERDYVAESLLDVIAVQEVRK